MLFHIVLIFYKHELSFTIFYNYKILKFVKINLASKGIDAVGNLSSKLVIIYYHHYKIL